MSKLDALDFLLVAKQAIKIGSMLAGDEIDDNEYSEIEFMERAEYLIEAAADGNISQISREAQQLDEAGWLGGGLNGGEISHEADAFRRLITGCAICLAAQHGNLELMSSFPRLWLNEEMLSTDESFIFEKIPEMQETAALKKSFDKVIRSITGKSFIFWAVRQPSLRLAMLFDETDPKISGRVDNNNLNPLQVGLLANPDENCNKYFRRIWREQLTERLLLEGGLVNYRLNDAFMGEINLEREGISQRFALLVDDWIDTVYPSYSKNVKNEEPYCISVLYRPPTWAKTNNPEAGIRLCQNVIQRSWTKEIPDEVDSLSFSPSGWAAMARERLKNENETVCAKVATEIEEMIAKSVNDKNVIKDSQILSIVLSVRKSLEDTCKKIGLEISKDLEYSNEWQQDTTKIRLALMSWANRTTIGKSRPEVRPKPVF